MRRACFNLFLSSNNENIKNLNVLNNLKIHKNIMTVIYANYIL